MAMAVLLQWGANVNAINLKNDTALLRAIRRGFLHCVELLISYGANPIPAVRPGMTNVLLPIQLARHTQQPEMQAILVTAIQRIEKYMLGLVKASLPPNAFLIDPGHMHHQDSVTPRSLSFFPVQLISLVDTTSFVFTFTTPPLYSQFFVTDEVQTSTISTEAEWIPDELILLYLLRVNLVEGALTPPRDGSLPTLTEINFNGLANRPELMKPDPSSGFRVFVLGSRLNNGGLNTLTLETPFSASQHAAAQPKARRRNLYIWRAPPNQSAPKDELPAPNEKILVGAYRVRMGATAFAQSPPRPGNLCVSHLTAPTVDTTDHGT
uniref:Ankyrin repeats (3 copies) n=3 Tax=Schistocephalus solidus TaxID=70667 RepID=A0A0V0JCH3_SCHSO